MAKIVRFFPNTQDKTHCLQACVKSVLEYYFPLKKFTDEEINEKTGQVGGWTWFPPTVIWLGSLGLEVKLYCPQEKFNYKDFSKEGLDYLRRCWNRERFEREDRAGAFKNISFVQDSSTEMVARGLWVGEAISSDLLAKRLEDKNYLAIGKTVYEWLSGKPGKTSHYIVVIKKYSPSKWRVHDPGLPPQADRKVPINFNGNPIIGDVLLVRKLI